jgi:hypothetical protein
MTYFIKSSVLTKMLRSALLAIKQEKGLDKKNVKCFGKCKGIKDVLSRRDSLF